MVRVMPRTTGVRAPVAVFTAYQSARPPPHATSPRYGVPSRPRAMVPSAVGVTVRMAVSASGTSLRSATRKAAVYVNRRSCAARTICTDCTSSSFQCHTSTLACGSSLFGGSASCSRRPMNTRDPSRLNVGAAFSLTTMPFGAAAASSSAREGDAAVRLEKTASALARCRDFSGASPWSTANCAPSSDQASPSKRSAPVRSGVVRPEASSIR